MITGGQVNKKFSGVIIYRGNMNTTDTALQVAVTKLVTQYPNASVIGIVGNLESGNEIEFQTVND